MLPLSVHFFGIKLNFDRIKSATKFPCVKTFSGKVVVRPFPYLTVHLFGILHCVFDYFNSVIYCKSYDQRYLNLVRFTLETYV